MMVVEHNSLASFIKELECEKDRIADKTVRWSTGRTPEQEEQVTFEVDVWATALRKGGDEDYLIELGQSVGCDDQERNAGSDAAAKMMQELEDACDRLGLRLMPGKIELF